MGLSKKEIELLINKIRNKYNDSAKNYGSNWFDIEAFEQRLRMTLDNKMNLEGFLLAEVANLEKIKETYDNKYKKETSFSDIVEKRMEENSERIKKYPEIRFHPLAHYEICHLYGAMREFALYYFPVLWMLLTGDLKERLIRLEDEFSYLAIPRGKMESKRIDDHLLILLRSNKKDIEVEKDKNEYLKESAFLLHKVIDFTKELLNKRFPEWEKPLTFEKLYIEGEKKRTISKIFPNVTGYGAILKINHLALQIIDDFRLSAFREKTF